MQRSMAWREASLHNLCGLSSLQRLFVSIPVLQQTLSRFPRAAWTACQGPSGAASPLVSPLLCTNLAAMKSSAAILAGLLLLAACQASR